MRILADENMPYVAELFGGLGEVTLKAGRAMTAADLEDQDLLLIRSVTKVNAKLLERANRLRFVGTATIGTDHVDQPLLAERGIAFSNAPGCNAPAVVDYVLAVLFHAATTTGRILPHLTYGVVGLGQIGQRLADRLHALGFTVLCCDPPRHRAGSLPGHVDIDAIIRQCDVISLHVPLLQQGPDATFHLLDEVRLGQLAPGALLVNASRGEVIDNRALLSVLTRRQDLDVALDVWEGEPEPMPALVARALIATPHIAGYSLEGKARGTLMLAAKVADLFGLTPPKALDSLLPPPLIEELRLGREPGWEALAGLVHAVYQPLADDRAMREHGLTAAGFDRLRREYPERRELAATTIWAPAAALPAVNGCGFRAVLHACEE